MTQPSLAFDAPQTVYALHRADVRAEVAQERGRRTGSMPRGQRGWADVEGRITGWRRG